MHSIVATLILLVCVLPIAAEPAAPYIRADFDIESRSQEDPNNGGQSVTIADLSMHDDGDAWFAMPSFQFDATNSAKSIRTGNITFAKTVATRSEGGRVIWHGADNSTAAEATLLRDADGAVAGLLSIGSFWYEMVQTHDGLVRIVMAPADTALPTEDVESSRGALSFLQDAFSASDDAVGEIPPSFLAKTVDTDVGPDDPPIACDQDDNDGELVAVVDVLVVVTHGAMCEKAFEASPCDLETHRGSMDRALAIAEARTNRAMQAVGVEVYTEFVDTVYIAPGFQTPATSTTLEFVDQSEDIERRRNQVGADLVAFIGTGDPKNEICGIAELQGAHSVTSHWCLPSALIHELGHNFGCMHHESDTFWDGLRGGYLYLNFFGYGYENEETFHTIMSYGCENNYCPEIPYFSSDRCTYDGAKMGDRFHNNAREIRRIAPGTSNYRERQDVTDLAAEITLFDTPPDGLSCHPHKAGVCGYGQSLLHYNFLWLICFQRCVDDDGAIVDFSFGISWLGWLGFGLDWVQRQLLCGPCGALINF